MSRPIVIAIILATLAALLTYYYLTEKEAAIRADQTPIAVLVAKQPIGKGSKIKPDKVTIKAIPGAYVMPGAVSGASSSEVKRLFENYHHQYTVVDIAKGEQILPNKLSRLMPGFAGAVQEGYRVAAFLLPVAAAVGGHLKPGNSVDVLGVFEHQFKDQKRTTAVVLAQNITVTSVGSSSLISQEEDSPSSRLGQNQQAKVVVSLSLKPEDALRLTLAEQEGALKLALRARNDENQLNLGDSHLGSLLGPLLHVQKEEIRPVKKRVQIIKGMD